MKLNSIPALMLVLLCSFPQWSVAAVFKRQVQVEWEAIDGAVAYEIELKVKKAKGKTFVFKTGAPSWSGLMPLGFYEMRLRAYDQRRVPGEWSPPTPYEVPLLPPELSAPNEQTKFQADHEEEKKDVELRWAPVTGAKIYHVQIENEKGDFKKNESLKDTKLGLTLAVGNGYKWSVKAEGEENLSGEPSPTRTFEVAGRVAAPEIATPENTFVRELKWSKPDHAEKFNVALSRRNKETKKWESVGVQKDYPSTTLPVDLSLPGGTYKVEVTALAERRTSAKFASKVFELRDGDRSPFAETTAEIRRSIDPLTGWYAVASYFVTMVKYNSTNYDTGNGDETRFSTLGGTGRIGLERFTQNKPWGFTSLIDASGMLRATGKRVTYLNAEASAIWRTDVTERGDLRIHGGLGYRELPIAKVNQTSGTVTSYQNASVLSPHLGVEYWYSMTPKLGFQINAHLYQSLFAVSSISGNTLKPSPSFQLGLLGSYRLGRRTTGLIGYARREDRLRYKPSNSNNSSNTNETSLTGHYLNLLLEWGF